MTESDDADLVEAVAEGFVRRLGRDAVPYLHNQEAVAERNGDALSAQAWHDIAEAAVQILGTGDNHRG